MFNIVTSRSGVSWRCPGEFAKRHRRAGRSRSQSRKHLAPLLRRISPLIEQRGQLLKRCWLGRHSFSLARCRSMFEGVEAASQLLQLTCNKPKCFISRTPTVL